MMSEPLRAISTYLRRVAGYDPRVIIIELLLIGVVVWWVTRFLRGTRGARLVKGITLLLVSVYVVIRLLPRNIGVVPLDWDRLDLLYKYFLLFAFVAAMVAFQPELRRALIQIGQTRFFRGARGEVEAMVDALVESVGYLSRNKIGALVAVERTVGLGALMETGTTTDADLTAAYEIIEISRPEPVEAEEVPAR